MPEWDIDLSEVDGLRQWYKKQPRMMQKASAMMLNNFAFGVRDEAVTQIGRLMIVRNERFVKNRLRVTKTSLSTPIAQQRSITGSIAGERFTGWTEQEKGTPTQRKRVSTLASRVGDIHRQMIPRSRLKPTNTVTTIDKYSKTPKGGATNYAGFVAMLAREGYKGLVRIKGGLYMIDKGGRRLAGPTIPGRGKLTSTAHLVLMQETKREQPKKKHWLRTARAIYFKKHPPERTWARTVDRLITPPSKK